jgi:hypothetical protein
MLGNCLIVSWLEFLVIGDFHQIIKSTTAFEQQLELTAACIAEQLCNISRFWRALLTRIPSGESIWGSRSKKDRLLKNQ